jgi:hypothetical protein
VKADDRRFPDAVPDDRKIPTLSNAIQDLLREPQPTLFLDMGQGSREQSLPVAVSCRELLIQTDQAAHCASRSVHSAPQEG